MGISGSVAAENPTLDTVGKKKGTVDLDIFVITKTGALWISYFIIKSLNAFVNLFGLSKYRLCFNYAMDESYLEVHNKNFFTATELFNLKKIGDLNYDKLYNENKWLLNYYPYKLSDKIPSKLKKSNAIIRAINFSLFSIFQFLRCFKRKNFGPLNEIHSRFSVGQRHNLYRVCPPNGGYQELIKEKFKRNFKSHIFDSPTFNLIEIMFPNESTLVEETKSEIYYQQEVEQNFAKYL